MDRKTNLPNPDYFSVIAALELDNLQYLVFSVKSNLEERRAEIEDEYAKKFKAQKSTNQKDSLTEEIEYIEELEALVRKLSVLGIYMVLENFIKKAMKWIYRDLNEEERNKKLRVIHKWDILIKETKNRCQFNLSEVNEYPVIDEIRCLNNVIKHSGGIVNEHLAAFSSWKTNLGLEVDTSRINLEKYCASIPLFIYGFVDRIGKSLSEANRSQFG